jgi:hypothetical protein
MGIATWHESKSGREQWASCALAIGAILCRCPAVCTLHSESNDPIYRAIRHIGSHDNLQKVTTGWRGEEASTEVSDSYKAVHITGV